MSPPRRPQEGKRNVEGPHVFVCPLLHTCTGMKKNMDISTLTLNFWEGLWLELSSITKWFGLMLQ